MPAPRQLTKEMGRISLPDVLGPQGSISGIQLGKEVSSPFPWLVSQDPIPQDPSHEAFGLHGYESF